ncbi:NAD(P)-dependent oxidoreductase [Mannheimia indoligenes]|uniref:NAD-dependent epimerase/dehydratase family protein n=1 Tax=Mannheimia indoligenes TaxID=3103145 RepID=UPI002FE6B70A
MNIIVTGANGYIGRNVVHSLLNKGHKVTAMLFDGETPHRLLDGANIYFANIFEISTEQLSVLAQNHDSLLHLAWQAGFNHRDPSHLENVMKHYHFLVSMAQAGIKTISVAGTMHEVGYFVGPIDADTPCNPRNPYGIAKNFLRQAMFDFASVTPELNLQWIRFYYITGDDRFSNSIFTKILKAEDEGQEFFPLNSGEMLYDFIDIRDLAQQIEQTISSQEQGIFNCCSGKPKSLRAAVEEFIQQHNLKIKPKYNVFPARTYDSMAVWGKK